MLNALAGADALEIVVLLKDMSEQGLRKLESNVKHAEASANGANFSGFSGKTKTLASDAEAAAGKAEKGGGGSGLGALVGGFLGLPGPIALAGAAVGGFAVLAGATIPVYEKVEKQEKALATAAQDHGIAVADMNAHVEASISVGEQYAFSADDTRAAITKLTEAGMSLSDQQAALPHIMDLARAKQLDLTEATRLYELALMGQSRGLKDLGISLPKLTDAQAAQTKATDAVTKAQQELAKAEQHLQDLQGMHVTSTQRVISSTKGHAASAAELTSAQEHLSLAQDRLTALQSKGNATALQLEAANVAVHDAEARLMALQGQHAVTTDRLTTKTKGHAASAIQLRDAQEKVKEATDKLKAAQEKAGGVQDAASQKAARFKQLNDDLTGAVGNQKDSITDLEKKQVTLGDKWETFSTKIAPALQAALGGVLDVLTSLVDVLSRALDFIGKIDQQASTYQQTHQSTGGIIGGARGVIGIGNLVGHHAQGGWVGLNGPELSWLGEKGPEFISPAGYNGAPSAGGPSVIHTHVYIDGRQVAEAVQRPLGRMLALGGTSAGLGRS